MRSVVIGIALGGDGGPIANLIDGGDLINANNSMG